VTLDKLSDALKKIETSLEHQSLTDQNLQDLRQQIDPLSLAVAGSTDQLMPRLAAIKDRLDQLGPKPADDAPPESPAVTAERTRQQMLFNDTDELLKRARLLSVEADQTAANITARRRALFTHSLFERATSLANPAPWIAVWQEAPSDLAGAAFGEWLDGIGDRLGGKLQLAFWGAAGFIVLVYFPLSRLARRVLARNGAVADPGRFLKILGAWWIALVIAIPAAAIVLLIGFLLQYLDLTNDRLLPFMWVCGEAAVRTTAAAGIARGLFAPTRPNWRLPRLNDRVAAGIVRVAVSLALVVSAARLFAALSDIAGASLPAAVLMRGLAALAGAIVIAVELLRFGNEVDAEDCLGPKVGTQGDWFDLLRAASWAVASVIFVSVIFGYEAFGSFLVDQFFWVGAVGCALFMSVVLVEEAISAGFTPNSRVGRRLITSIGIHRNSLELVGVLTSGAIKLALFVLAVLLLLAPWGVQSSDVPVDFRAAFFGFKVGDTTISPVNILIAAGIFALSIAALHAGLQWADSKLLPKMNFDVGLRSSIHTSLAYVGFVIAAGLALGYVGLNFEKLALVAGVLSVGIGFGLQSIVNNFVSGLILLWERTVRVGDWIIVGADQGFVRRINVRATEIETFDRAQVIIPNASLVGGVVTNLVRNDRTGRIVIPLTVVASADPEKVREVLVAIAKANSLILPMPSPQVLFTGLSASALNFELRAFVGDVETLYRVKSDLHFAIFKRFKEERFFESPQPIATKIEIAGFEDFGRNLNPPTELALSGHSKQGTARR
jgi:potassium-dependent mechanosensitive channel